MKQQKPAIEAPMFWDNDNCRPHCPNCQLRMILVAAAQADRRYECLRCKRADDIMIEQER
jgi:hypothetical protein